MDREVPLTKKLDELYALVGSIEVAMFTTRRADGRLVSRPMQTQERIADSDLWFVTNAHDQKLDELATNPEVNLAYYNSHTREWVSVSGSATVSQDRARIRQLYKADWKVWFGDEGGVHDGGPDDPRIALILVIAESVTYQVVHKPRPVVLFEIAKALLTGKPPKIGELREVNVHELHGQTGRSPA
ncbi:MAG: hypothetical protein NVS4B3_09480 [Gemmatimonadaceae bacterium]